MQTTIEGPFGLDVSRLKREVFSTLYPFVPYTYINKNGDMGIVNQNRFYEKVITERRFFYQIPKHNRSKRKTKQIINELS